MLEILHAERPFEALPEDVEAAVRRAVALYDLSVLVLDPPLTNPTVWAEFEERFRPREGYTLASYRRDLRAWAGGAEPAPDLAAIGATAGGFWLDPATVAWMGRTGLMPQGWRFAGIVVKRSPLEAVRVTVDRVSP